MRGQRISPFSLHLLEQDLLAPDLLSSSFVIEAPLRWRYWVGRPPCKWKSYDNPQGRQQARRRVARWIDQAQRVDVLRTWTRRGRAIRWWIGLSGIGLPPRLSERIPERWRARPQRIQWRHGKRQ